MAATQILDLEAFPAGADLSTKQFHAVKFNGDGALVTAGDGDDILGILEDKPKSGEQATVSIAGRPKAKLGGNVAPGALLAVNANAQLITAAAGKRIVARAMESGAAGEIIQVQPINPGAIVPTP
ncbi:hypothetical protein GAY28_32610 [Azospirillum brasilense]|nr:hypothetical protein [Azospirillum brasilense]